jgi:hypothetical protein
MSAIRSYSRLSAADRILFVRAVSLVAMIRIGLWAIPFKVLYRLLVRIPGNVGQLRRSSAVAATSEKRLVWAVRAAARRIPQATCLTQALALQSLMGLTGQQSHVQIGVARDDSGKFEAHAWVESCGRILLNTPAEVARYARLVSLGRPALDRSAQ